MSKTLEQDLNEFLNNRDSREASNLSSNQMTTNLDSSTTTGTSGFDLLLEEDSERDKRNHSLLKLLLRLKMHLVCLKANKRSHPFLIYLLRWIHQEQVLM